MIIAERIKYSSFMCDYIFIPGLKLQQFWVQSLDRIAESVNANYHKIPFFGTHIMLIICVLC